MNTTTILFNGKTPREDEFARLTSVPFEKKPISANERNLYIKKGFGMIGIGVACIVGGLLFGYLLRNFVILFIIPCLLIGILVAAAGPFIAIGGAISNFGKILTDPRKKSKEPTSALQKYLSRVLIGDDSANCQKKNANYAFEVLERIIPASSMPEYGGFVSYVKEFREKMVETAKRDYNQSFNETLGDAIDIGGGNSLPIESISSETVSQGITKLKAKSTITLSSSRSTGNNSSTMVAYSCFELIFDAVIVQSGEYWYMYDPMPEYRIEGY